MLESLASSKKPYHGVKSVKNNVYDCLCLRGGRSENHSKVETY